MILCQSASLQERELFTNCITAWTFNNPEDLIHLFTDAKATSHNLIIFCLSYVCTRVCMFVCVHECVCVYMCVVSGEVCFVGTFGKGCMWSSHPRLQHLGAEVKRANFWSYSELILLPENLAFR